MVKVTVFLLGLAGAPALAQPEADREDQRWVCVPTEDRQWRCGRGAQAPEPRPLPPERPAGSAPEDDEPRGAASRLPNYLRESPDQVPDATATPTAGADEGPEARTDSKPATVTDHTEPAPGRKAESETSPVAARYGIQLVAGRDRDSVEDYREHSALEPLEVYQGTWEDAGGVWHVLLAGRFETVAAARQALDELPEAVRQSGAWVRSLDELDIPTNHSRDPQSD